MKKVWSDIAWEDYLYWQKEDKKIVKKINKIIQDIERNPFNGIGKPEPLRHELKGCWSRRIDKYNRFVYFIENDSIEILICKSHYDT